MGPNNDNQVSMTVTDALRRIQEDLMGVNIPVSLLDTTGVQIRRAVQNLDQVIVSIEEHDRKLQEILDKKKKEAEEEAPELTVLEGGEENGSDTEDSDA